MLSAPPSFGRRAGAVALCAVVAGLCACSDDAVTPDASTDVPVITDRGADVPVITDRGADVPAATVDAGVDVPVVTNDVGFDVPVTPVDTGVDAGAEAAVDGGSNGPPAVPNPNVPMLGTAANGRDVFRFETFGNEGFWTDVARLPQGAVAAGFTPVQALRAGFSVDIDAVPAALRPTVAAELMTDLSPANAPNLNNPATTVALLNANAVIGLVARDSNANGTIDIASGDKLGVACALCHSISDGSTFPSPMSLGGGGIGHRVDGPTPHNLNVGAAFALAANSRGLYPLLQLALTANGGATIGRAPTGLTELSTEAEVDAYLSNPAYYPVGMFDDSPDGNGAPMHITPMFRADLAAPWGSEGGISHLDNFSNLVYTVLFDPTRLLTPGGQAFLHARGGVAADEIIADYRIVLAATGSPTGPFVTGTAGTANTEDFLAGVRVDNTRLLDLNAYMSSLPAPAGAAGDATAVAAGRNLFRYNCTGCHNVDQSTFVPPGIVPMATIWPGYMPMVLATRDAPHSPVQNSPGIFDDKMVVNDASFRTPPLARGTALPLLLDLARKPVFLHDNSVPDLDTLLNPSRGATAPHPVYFNSATDRTNVVAFLRSLSAP